MYDARSSNNLNLYVKSSYSFGWLAETEEVYVMKKGLLLLLGGWATVTVGLFLATVAGTIAEEQFAIVGNGQLVIQATVMSIIIVPIIIYLYQQLYRLIGKPERPVYSLIRGHYFFTGFFLAAALAVVGLFIASALGWIEIEQWHQPQDWIGALLINMLIAFFYEALPEELALRGFVYDVLRHRFAVWLSVLAQTLLFVAFSIGVSLLQVIVGMSTVESIFIIPHMILLFFFGIALALTRVWTGSLWAAIGFHLGYLAMARFFMMPTEYGAPPIVIFQDLIMDGVGSSFLTMLIILGAIFILLVFLGIKYLWKKNHKKSVADGANDNSINH